MRAKFVPVGSRMAGMRPKMAVTAASPFRIIWLRMIRLRHLLALAMPSRAAPSPVVAGAQSRVASALVRSMHGRASCVSTACPDLPASTARSSRAGHSPAESRNSSMQQDDFLIAVKREERDLLKICRALTERFVSQTSRSGGPFRTAFSRSGRPAWPSCTFRIAGTTAHRLHRGRTTIDDHRRP